MADGNACRTLATTCRPQARCLHPTVPLVEHAAVVRSHSQLPSTHLRAAQGPNGHQRPAPGETHANRPMLDTRATPGANHPRLHSGCGCYAATVVVVVFAAYEVLFATQPSQRDTRANVYTSTRVRTYVLVPDSRVHHMGPRAAAARGCCFQRSLSDGSPSSLTGAAVAAASGWSGISTTTAVRLSRLPASRQLVQQLRENGQKSFRSRVLAESGVVARADKGSALLA
jgi:hypothetical protein